MKYDFILFENYHQATHHIYDMYLIAQMLNNNGLKVAVLDIYNELPKTDNKNLTILRLPIKRVIPNDKWCRKPKGKVYNLLCLIRFLWQQHFYMKEVLKEVEPLADRFYCGSYHLSMSTIFFHSHKPCYYWGLRSSRMTHFITHFKTNPILGIRMLMLRNTFMKKTTQSLFVSNEIIKNEFKKLGIPTNRLIIREERCITEKGEPKYENLSNRCSFLTIGLLRPDKRIEFSINEFSKCHRDDWLFILAGRSQGDYESMISRSLVGKNNILRINKFLEYDDFNMLFSQSHFLVLADKRQPSSVTNGTMMEALINYRPIIAPNYNPYHYYIKKYGIGITYNPDESGSLTQAMKQAEEKGCRYFRNNIELFLKTIDFKFVSKSLYQQIYE